MARASDKTQAIASARIAVDAMGGDSGPAAMLGGMARALKSDPSLRFLVIGDQTLIGAELAKHNFAAGAVDVLHAPDAIGGSEKPSQALRRARTTSMAAIP